MNPTRRLPTVIIAFALLMLFGVACQGKNAELARFTENSVEVVIRLEKMEAGYQLSAQFTPPAGYHLYSKDIPRGGVEGLGRPTLLELPAEAKIQAAGALSESVTAQVPAFEPKALLVYPAGPVTLTLPITLPETTDQFEAVVSVSFMACSETGCKPPVIGKMVTVQIKP